jgi:protein SCO1
MGKKMKKRSISLCIFIFFAGVFAWGHEETAAAAIGFNEKLGALLPLDARFTGEDGKQVRLGDLVTSPTILSLVYYRCKNECNTQLIGISSALRDMESEPGKAYRLVTVSINEKETPEDAIEKKNIAIAAIEKPFPPEEWRFLVGDSANIDRIADAIGFSYTRHGDDFDHPLGLVIVSPEGKIVRYMTGTDFLPVDLGMSLMEASDGLVRPTIAKMLRFCFSYNPASRQFGFDILRVSSIVIVALISGFVLYLVLAGKKRRRGTLQRGN